MKQALLDSQKFSADSVQKQMGEIDPEQLPADLRDAYFEMIKCGVKARLSKDSNYESWKDKGKVPNLDALRN